MNDTKEELIDKLKGLSNSEFESIITELRTRKVAIETPEIVMMSTLPEEREERTKVIVMDRKMRRKIRAGEEEKLNEIAEAEGTVESDLSIPGGTTTISGPTINHAILANAIASDFGPVCSGGKIFLSDSKYFLYHDQDIIKVLSEDLTDLQMWIAQYFDCDDFAQVVAGQLNRQLKGIPFGVLWFKGPGIYHAVNCFYSLNQMKMKVVEPQTNAIYDFNKNVYCPMLVVI